MAIQALPYHLPTPCLKSGDTVLGALRLMPEKQVNHAPLCDGNGSLVGARANLVVAGFAERASQPIRFMPFLLMAFPLMLVGILVGTGYVW